MTGADAPGGAVDPLAAGRRLLAGVFADPFRGELFPTLALLETATAPARRLGRPGDPGREGIRLRACPSLAFPSADLARVRPRTGGDGVERVEVEVTCFGLYGPASPLPTYYTQRLIDEAVEGGERLRGFLDILNHRLLSLLYRTWRKYRLASHAPQDSGLAGRLRALLGADAVDEAGASAPLGQIGLLRRRPATPRILARAIRVRFPEAPLEVEGCVLRWTRVDLDQRLRLGRPQGRLGRDAILGERIRNRSLTFAVRLGPLDGATFRDLLPGGERQPLLRDVVERCNGEHLDWDCELLVAPGQLPPARLSGGHALARNCRLAGSGTAPYRVVVRYTPWTA